MKALPGPFGGPYEHMLFSHGTAFFPLLLHKNILFSAANGSPRIRPLSNATRAFPCGHGTEFSLQEGR